MKWESASELCRDLQRGTVSALELMQEVYRRIDAINPQVNALVNVLPAEEAFALARLADEVPVAQRGPLHGLPMAPKDAVEVQGFPTTWGFTPYAQQVAAQDDKQAARLRAAGVIFIGHSNMPELGLGSHTFNSIFGHTHNPYDVTRTPGGSSGGAAAALATQMLPLADGSDMGGSLRNPASFCNVVGMRPSIGRTPAGKGMSWFARMVTTGPMARTVADTALLMSVQAGPDPRDPLTLPEPGHTFLDAYVPAADMQSLKIAYSPDLGELPIAAEVQHVIAAAADTLANLGAQVELASPDLSGAMDVFQVQRAAGLANLGRALDRAIPDWRKHAKDTAIWNIEQGLALSSAELLGSELIRSEIYTRVAAFFTQYDALILPAAQVAPFARDIDWIREINGQSMHTYIDWMAVCCMITVTGLPAISVPAGFTDAGLPVGVQIVGKPRGDLELLRLAHAFEAATRFYTRTPAICAV